MTLADKLRAAQVPVAWAESYDGGRSFLAVRLRETRHHRFPLYSIPDPVREAMIEAVAALEAIAALGNISGMEFARNYPQLNKALDLAEKSDWPDILSDYAYAAIAKLTAALESSK